MKMKIEKIVFATVILLLSSCGSIPKEKNSDGSENKHFIWDFNKEIKYIYSYSQTVETESRISKSDAVSKTYMTGIGNLNVRVKPNNLADLSLTNMELSMIMFNEDGTPTDTMTHTSPPTVVQDMKPNGSFDEPNSNLLFDILFPLPSQDLKEGQSDKTLMKIPFNANGSVLFSKGFNTLSFTGFKTIKGRKCAVLEGILDISKLEIPEELDGEYKSATTGNATYYFDIEDHCYVGADIHMIMDVMMDTESEGQDDFGMYMEMKSDNIFKIRLERLDDSKYQISDQKNSIDQTIDCLDETGFSFRYNFKYDILKSDLPKIVEIKSNIKSTVREITDTLRLIDDCILKKDSIESWKYRTC
jgi:hypothetical protein